MFLFKVHISYAFNLRSAELERIRNLQLVESKSEAALTLQIYEILIIRGASKTPALTGITNHNE